MKKYILNSAVITSPGAYIYKTIDSPFEEYTWSFEEAMDWLEEGGWESTIGYPETALAMESLFNIPIPVNRKIVKMEIGDEALVFRLTFPPGTPRITPDDKGRLDIDFILKHCEIGLLTREG